MRNLFGILGGCLFGCLFTFCAGAMSVTLAWNASSDPTVTGYNIYYGGASGNYTNTLSSGNATNITIAGLVAGVTYYFAATTYNSSGVQSAFSNEVHYNSKNVITATRTGSTMMLNIPCQGPYTLWESKDLKGWNFYGSGIGPTNVLVQILPNVPALFFRFSY